MYRTVSRARGGSAAVGLLGYAMLSVGTAAAVAWMLRSAARDIEHRVGAAIVSDELSDMLRVFHARAITRGMLIERTTTTDTSDEETKEA